MYIYDGFEAGGVSKVTGRPCTVEVKYDRDPESPRDVFDNIGEFRTWMRRHASPDGDAEIGEIARRFGIDMERCDGNPIPYLANELERLGHFALPVSAYIHSGITYSIGSPSQFPDSRWDAGYAGLIFCSRPDLVERMGGLTEDELRATAHEAFEDEVSLYDAYAQGEVYGFVVRDDETGEEIDSCWGFYGDDPEQNGMSHHLEEYGIDFIKDARAR